MHIVIDIIAAGILVLFTYNGYKRGLIYTVLRLIISIVALSGAFVVTKLFAQAFSAVINPMITGWIQRALENGGGSSAIAKLFLGAMGAPQNALASLAGGASALDAGIVSWLSAFVSDYVAYMLLFILSYTILTVILKIVLKAVNLISKLPVISVFNRLGGLAAGFALGCVVIFILGWMVTFSGGLIAPEILAKTLIFSKFVQINPLNKLALL